jgi:hypothetical protein
MMPGGSKLLIGRGGKFAVKINKISSSIASSSQGTSTRLSEEKYAVEIVENVEGFKQIEEKKSSNLRKFWMWVFGRCF